VVDQLMVLIVPPPNRGASVIESDHRVAPAGPTRNAID